MPKFELVDLPIPATKARPEANPLEWEELTPEQRRAAVGVWGLVRSLLDIDIPHSRFHARGQALLEQALPPIDARRHSQVVLIDGGRGSGKTALLVSLLARWIRAVRAPSLPYSASSSPRERANSFDDLCDGSGRVIPLGVIDLRGLSPATSLMMHVASLAHSLVDAADQARPRAAVPTDPHARRQSEARTCWDAFVRAASALELRTGSRSETIDPETFAIELREAERDRLDLHERFSLLIDALVDFIHELRNGQGWPLFVIAIDDADLNPRRALEAFEMLEKFRHPRLAFVMTGHSDAFGPLLRNRLLAEFRMPLQSIPVAAYEHERIGDLPAVESLAKQLYDKVIPPAHRCALHVLSPMQRYTLIREELGEIALEDERFTNLSRLFAANPELAWALPETMREMIDLRSRVAGLASDPTGAAEFAKIVWDAALAHEHGRAGELARAREPLFASAEAQQIDGRPRYRLDCGILELAFEQREIAKWGATRLEERALSISALAGIRATIAEPGEVKESRPHDKKEIRLDLSNRATHAYALALDVAELGSTLRSNRHPEDFGKRGSPIFASFNYRDLQIRWWLPSWPGTIHQALFARIWNERVRSQRVESPEGLVVLFIDCVLSVYREDAKRSSLTMRDIIRECYALASAHPATALERWVHSDLLQFWYPESGLPRAIRVSFIHAFESACPDGYDDFLRSEKRRYDRYEARSLHYWIEDVHHLVGELPSPQTSFHAAAIAKLRDNLARFPFLPPAREQGSWLPGSLAGYLTDEMLSIIPGVDCADIDTLATRVERACNTTADLDLLLEQTLSATGIYSDYELRWNPHERTGRFRGADDERPTRQRYRSNLPGVDFGVSEMYLSGPHHLGQRGLAHLVIAFHVLVSIDLPRTRRKGQGREDDSWKFVHTWSGDNESAQHPWPCIQWTSALDLVVLQQAWHDEIGELARSGAEEGTRLEWLARYFVWMQAHLYRKRRHPDKPPRDASWRDLVAWCWGQRLEAEDGKPDADIPLRSVHYRHWLERLHHFARPQAGLKPRSAIEILLATHHYGLLPEALAETDDVRAFVVDHHPDHPWTRLLQSTDRDHTLDEFRAELGTVA